MKIKLPIFFKLFSAVLFWAMNVIVTKYLTAYLETSALATLRLLLSASFLLPIALWRHGLVRLSRQAWVLVAGVALLSFALHQLTLIWGIANTSGTHAVLILGLLPLATALLASIFLKEGLNGGKIIGLILAFGGVVLVALNKGSNQVTLAGDLMMIMSMLSYAGGSVLVKKCDVHAPSLIISAYSLVIASFAVLILMLGSGVKIVSVEVWQPGPIAALLYLSWLSTGLGTLWWNEGIYQIGASTTSLFFNVVPVIGVIGSVIFLGDKLLPAHILALALILLGVCLGSSIGVKQLKALFPKEKVSEQLAEVSE